MDFLLILCIISLIICAVSFTIQIIIIIKFLLKCRREGVKAVKFSFNVSTAISIVITIGFFVGIVHFFNEADYCKKAAEEAEALVGTGFEEYYAKQQEKEHNIIILDPEKYLQDMIQMSKNTSTHYSWLGISFIIWFVDGILSLVSFIYVITGVGLRNSRIKDIIPIFAEYDRQNAKIIIKANDLNGKTEKLLTFNANPRNLASLGQFIEWDEQTTQEVIQ